MIREAIQSLLTPCPWFLRRMGYAREQAGISGRLARNKAAWAPHQAATREAILAAAALCQGRRTAVLLGAGLLYDVPLAELTRFFDRVVLADLLHTPWPWRIPRLKAERVRYDCTGALDALWRAGGAMGEEEAIHLFQTAQPPPLPEADTCDLVVSVNLASQLGSLPADWLCAKRPRSPGFSAQLRIAAAARHVGWLRGLSGVRCLVADRTMIVRERDGTESEREPLLDESGLGPPERAWTWNLAPIPEWCHEHHLEHEVGAWIFPPAHAGDA